MAFGGGFDDDGQVMSEINMTPLVDVMLVLLIIFMLTVPVLTHSVKLDLPQASNQPSQVKPDTVNLSVTADGKLHWNETAVDEAEFARRLAAAAATKPQPEFQLRGDRVVEYQHVVKAMAAIQRAGIQKLGFVTEPEG
ncbi:ExbD/TolR family protein [Chitinimonas lacunae]|uniref:ExbD/TolR family protein n=1 Tax=Chitinimonas lacunae TaxID=1963018 RepID=A0ABV8MML9_9NEIS